MKHILISTLLLLFTFCCNAQNDPINCDESLCTCKDDITPAGIMISHVHKKNEWMVSYRYMNMSMEDYYAGAQKTSSDNIFNQYLSYTQKMRMDMHMLMGMYGINDKLTLMAMLNYNNNNMQMKMYATDSTYKELANGYTSYSMSHSMHTKGFGDIKIYFMYNLLNNSQKQFLINLGVSIPTGSINLKGAKTSMMYPSTRYAYNMQNGSGTFDLMPSINYLRTTSNWSASIQLLSTIRTHFNSVGYKLGNELNANAWFAYKFLPFMSSSIRVEESICGKIHGEDSSLRKNLESAANTYNSGVQKTNLYLGTLFQFQKGILNNFKIGIEYGIPVHQKYNGTQLGSKSNLNFNIVRLF